MRKERPNADKDRANMPRKLQLRFLHATPCAKFVNCNVLRKMIGDFCCFAENMKTRAYGLIYPRTQAKRNIVGRMICSRTAPVTLRASFTNTVEI